MNNIEQLNKTKYILTKIGANPLNESEYIDSYFNNDNYSDYIEGLDNLDDKQEKAIEMLFDKSINDIVDRCTEALGLYPYCFEALFIIYHKTDSLFFYYQIQDFFNAYYTEILDYKQYLEDFASILLLVYEYYMDIRNISQAEKTLVLMSNIYGEEAILSKKMIFCCFVEDDITMMDLYNKYGFNRPIEYILLIVTLLKRDKMDDAKLVYEDMLSEYKYADLLCDPKLLQNLNDEESKIMMNALETCIGIIESYPMFFSWASEVIEEKKP